MEVLNVSCSRCGRVVKHCVKVACSNCSTQHGMCTLCGESRTLLRIRAMLGARPGEDVVELVRQLVFEGKIRRSKPEGESVLQTGLERATDGE